MVVMVAQVIFNFSTLKRVGKVEMLLPPPRRKVYTRNPKRSSDDALRRVIVTTNGQAERSASPLTRMDVELLISKVESSADLDLSFQNLKHIDLSYMDLHGANLRGADLQGAYLRGANLSDAYLQGANLSKTDLDGADLSRAHLSDSDANRVDLHGTRLSHATLRDLDLHGFDLSELDLHKADLNGTDLRAALLRGTDLHGADLSTAQLHGPELHGAILYRNERIGEWLRHTHRGSTRQEALASDESTLKPERSLPQQRRDMKQIRKTLSDQEAYLLGEQALLADSDQAKIRRLFPQDFSFAIAHQLFDTWLTQIEDGYNEREIQAMWIGFAHRIYDLYHEGVYHA